jgi:Carboxypeptidase regulatory-like domain
VKPVQALTGDYPALSSKRNFTEGEINQQIPGMNSSSVRPTINGIQSTSSEISPVTYGVTISGRVVDADTGLPIANAVVQSDSTLFLIGLTTRTDVTGYFLVTISSWQHPAGSIKLRINRDGYDQATKEITDPVQFIGSLGIPLRKTAHE